MLNKIRLGTLLALSFYGGTSAYAQSLENFTFSGNLHVNYFYNTAQPGDGLSTGRVYDVKHNQIYFPMSQISVGYEKEETKVVLDLNFGPAAPGVNLNTFGGQNDMIQNAYLVEKFGDKFSVEAGKFGTHIGYEVIDPTINMNYSFSYLFYYGPFTHVGARARYAVSDTYSLMFGVYNNWDNLEDNNSGKTFAGSVGFTPSKSFTGSVNWIGGYEGTSDNYRSLFDLVLNYTVSDKFLIGSNTIYGQEGKSWYGEAVYLKYTHTDKMGVALRLEHMNDERAVRGLGTSVSAATLTGSFAYGSSFTFKPELRYETAGSALFTDDVSTAHSKSQLTFGAAMLVKF
jgi:hypothetical protein